MVEEGECPPEEFGGGAPGAPAVRVVPRPAVAPAFPSLSGLIDLISGIFAFIRSGAPVYVKAATRSEIQQYLAVDTTKYTQLTTIPSDALSWEMWNSDLGSATGTLEWAYVTEPGTVPSGKFNRLALNDRVSRALAGVGIYVKPANANQVVVIEVLRP